MFSKIESKKVVSYRLKVNYKIEITVNFKTLKHSFLYKILIKKLKRAYKYLINNLRKKFTIFNLML